jgi:phosphatidylethanolamine-binding protein (PEBP) family uncharacterized protein
MRHRSLLLACLVVTAGLVAAACSTSGRDLRETDATIPPSMDATTTTVVATGATPVEGLNGFALSSPDFTAGGALPQTVGANNGNRSPALSWTGTPESAAELALVVTDETGGIIYWFVTGITTTDLAIEAGSVPEGGVEQATTAGPRGWSGPITAPGATAELVFALYALENPLIAAEGDTAHALRERMIADSFATASLRGTFTAGGTGTTAGASAPSTGG